jgi:hypothetical protein
MNGDAIGILESLTPRNYNTYQEGKMKNFIENNNETLDNYLLNHPYQNNLAKNNNFGYNNSCADTYPDNAPIEYIEQRQKNLSGIGGVNPMGPIDRTKQEDFVNFLPINDPTSDNLLDINKRPMTDFYHNNMVPYYGAKQTQNMAGTGVPTGNYTDGVEINSGFDESTPYEAQMGNYTGIYSEYLHKRETGPRFSPAEQQTGWVYGSPDFRPDMDRYKENLNNLKNELSPVEAIKVGPGLNLSSEIPASGGFHDFTRILPNNVSDYKANQLPGRVIYGKFNSAELPTSYPGIGSSLDKTAPGITKNKPNSYWDQIRYPTMTTKVAFQENLDYIRPDYQADFKPKSALRDQTSFGLGNVSYKRSNEEVACVNEEVNIGQGPLGSKISQMPTRSETFMSMDNNIRSKTDCNSMPIGNPQRSDQGFSNVLSNWYVNETDRGTVNPQNVMQLNLTRERNGFTNSYRFEDLPKTTSKESTEYTYIGNASRENDGTKFWTYTDEFKTTNKETTDYAYIGNASRENDGTKFWSYEDLPKTTSKESTEYSYASNPAKMGFAETNRSLFTGYN